MFGFARWVVRHKVGATAVVALAVFYMTPNKNEEVPQSNNPWAVQTAPVAAEEPGMLDGMVDTAMDSTVAYLDEAGMNPLAKSDEAVGRLEDTATAMGGANGRN